MFGTKEYLQKIQDLDLRGPNGEALYLGYKYSHHSFIAPYRTTDDGYILGVVGEQRYYPLNAALIERLQAQKRLPVPLPPYELSALDYLFGYLLWIILAGIGVSIVFSIYKQRSARRRCRLPKPASRTIARETSMPRSLNTARRSSFTRSWGTC